MQIKYSKEKKRTNQAVSMPGAAGLRNASVIPHPAQALDVLTRLLGVDPPFART